MTTMLFVPGGIGPNDIGGERFAPLQVNSSGIRSPSLKASEVISIGVMIDTYSECYGYSDH